MACGTPSAITEGSWQTQLQIGCGSTYQTRNKPNVISGCAMILELPSSAFWKRSEGLQIPGELRSGNVCVRMTLFAAVLAKWMNRAVGPAIASRAFSAESIPPNRAPTNW